MRADSDVDEVDHPSRRAEAVEKIAHGAAANEGDRSYLDAVFARGLFVEICENPESSEGEQHEPPAGRWTEGEAHRSFGVVCQSETQNIVDNVVRDVGRSELADGDSFRCDVYEDGREQDRPESIGSLRHESR